MISCIYYETSYQNISIYQGKGGETLSISNIQSLKKENLKNSSIKKLF